MGQLLIRDLKREWKILCLTVILLCLIPVLLLIVYIDKKEVLFKISAAVFAAPEEIYALFGLVSGTSTGSILFYMRFLVMLLNIVYICYSCMRIGRNVFYYNHNGSLFTLFEWYSRKKLLIEKYLWTIISAVLVYIIFYLFAGLMLIKGSVTTDIAMDNFHKFIPGMYDGIIVLVILMSLTFMTVMFGNKSIEKDGVGWAVFWSVGCMLIGNLYKIPGIIYLVGDRMGINIARNKNLIETLKYLKNISFLSWLNPYEAGINLVYKIVICLVSTVFSVVISDIIYERKNLNI